MGSGKIKPAPNPAPVGDVSKALRTITKPSAVDPIQLPVSYKYNTLDSSDMKLDFTFDEELAKLSDDPHMTSRRAMELSGNHQLPSLNGESSASARNSISSATETTALNFKIASVKSVWDGFDRG